METSLKELLINKEGIELSPEEIIRVDKIISVLEIWKKIFNKLPVVVSIKDFSSDLSLNFILEIEVCTTRESFQDTENFPDRVSIYVNEDIKILIGQHTFQNHSGGLTNTFDLWVNKFCPGYVFPESFSLSGLKSALSCLEIMYGKFVPNLVN